MSSPVLAVRVVANVAEMKKALAEGQAQIVTTTAQMAKMAAAYQGDKLIMQSHNLTAAITQIGGASKLTEAEADRVHATLSKAIEKYRVLGKEAPAAMVALAEATRRVETPTVSLEQRLTALGGTLRTLGAGLTATVTAPIVGLGAAALKFGMDAVESENLVSVAFGAMRNQADAWSKSLSSQLGLNQFELRKTAGTIFTMTNSMGLAKDESFAMATGVAQLAADMASFRNLRMEDTLEKIRSGLTGEAEPLKALGILVDEATVKAYAYQVGIAAQGAELTQQQKVMARWGVILKQTSNDQGDLARTLDSPANKLRVLKERVTETATELGIKLLPYAEKAIAVMLDVAARAQALVHWFGTLPSPVRTATVGLAAFAAGAGPVVYGVGSMAGAVRNLLPLLTALGSAQTLGGLSGLVGLLGNPAVLAAAAVIGGVGFAVYNFHKNLAQLEATGQRVGQTLPGALDGLGKPLLTIDQVQTQTAQSAANMAARFKLVEGQLVEIKTAALPAADALKKVAESGAAKVADPLAGRGLAFGAFVERMQAPMIAALPTVTSLNDALADLGERTLPVVAVGLMQAGDSSLMMARKATAAGSQLAANLRAHLKAFPELMVQALTGGGGALGAVRAFGSQMGSDVSRAWAGSIQKHLPGKFGEALASVVGPLGALVGPLIGKIFGGPSEAELAGREAARRFEQGVAAGLTAWQRQEAGTDRWRQTVVGVRDAYLAVGRTAAEAEAAVAQLYAAERRGPEAVAAVQASMQGVLDQAARLRQGAAQFGPSRAELQQMGRDARATYDYMLASGQYTAEQLAAAFEASQEAQARALGVNTELHKKTAEMIQTTIDGLQRERDQLWQQIAAEAPEEVMGVIEAGQRAQLANLDQQLAAQRVHLAAQAEAAATELEMALGSLEPSPVHVPIVWDVPGLPGLAGFDERPEITPLAEGGFGVADGPTLLMVGEKGREEFAASGANRTFEQAGFPGGAGTDVSRLEGHMAALRRDFKQLPEMLSLAMRSGLRQARRA